VFDIHEDDRYFCGGDVGWITGHTYVVYAPLLLGCATVVFESTPAYPNFSRYWDVIDKYDVTQFYVAPTALRLLKRAGDEHIHHKMKSLRVLGSVGEPIAAEVWKWYFESVGKEEAHICDVSLDADPYAYSEKKYWANFEITRLTGKPRLVLT
jgi:acetyl-CoA synthetase